MGLYLGIDIGTSGTKTLVVDDSGRILAQATSRYQVYHPKPLWSEQDPEDWWQATIATVRAATRQAKAKPADVKAIGLSGQMHGSVFVDKRHRVLRRAILWNDQRTAEAVQEIEEAVPGEELIRRTGNPAITGFQLPKLLWLRREEPENFARTRHSLLPKDYLGYALTGVMAAEPSDASGTNCFNLTARSWDEDILAALGLSPALFPEVVPSHAVVGRLTEERAGHTGLPAGLPVVAGAGDNAAAAIALGISSLETERGSVSLGTSGVIFAPLREARPDPQGRVHLFCHADGGYHLLGVTLSAAGSLQWYRDTFAPGTAFSELIELALQSRPGAGGVSFRPYLAGERTPFMNPDLRASWTGLSLATTRADVVRSVLEGVAFSLRDVLDVMTPLTSLETCLVTGGGARSSFWLQLVADVLELPLAVPARNQGAAYGAALLAMRGAGLVGDTREVVSGETTATVTPAAPGRYAEALAAYRRWTLT